MQPEPIHITVPGSSRDPRSRRPSIPGVVVHEAPELHPDDLCVIDGIPATAPARTLIDCAETCSAADVDEMFARAIALGLVDRPTIEAALSRVEWRPSLAVVRGLVAKHFG